jgi:hypothetical protein
MAAASGVMPSSYRPQSVKLFSSPFHHFKSSGDGCKTGMYPALIISHWLTHNVECSYGEKGVTAELSFKGVPPFQLIYEIQRNKEMPQQVAKSFFRLKEDLVLEPTLDGHYIYTFSQVSDGNYKNIPILEQRFQQDVSVPPSAVFVSGRDGPAGRMMDTCETEIVPVEVELRVSRITRVSH